MEKTSQNILKKIEDLKKEIKILKEDNAKTKRNLMWKVRKLEKDKLLVENEKMRLDREVKSLRGEIERFRSPPLVIATVTEVLDEGKVVVKSSTGPHFVIGYSRFLDEKSLEPGVRVALNQQTFSIVSVLPSEKDPLVTGMEVDEKPDVNYVQIGGLEEQIVEIKETVELPLKNQNFSRRLE